jgi:DUF1365 family protein
VTISCLYEGSVRHRRATPASGFRYPIGLAYLDLDEIPELLGGRLLRRGPGLARFRRRDYLGDQSTPLASAVREAVATEIGSLEPGPIRLLTQLRSLGVCFNPVSFYYCFAADGRTLQAVVADVTNTPWGERHAYVIAADAEPAGTSAGRNGISEGRFEKAMHVSPFMGMEHDYHCRLTNPSETLSVHIESLDRAGERQFDATLALRRRVLSAAALRRWAASGARTLALIYGNALALRLRGAQYFPHPGAGASA